MERTWAHPVQCPVTSARIVEDMCRPGAASHKPSTLSSLPMVPRWNSLITARGGVPQRHSFPLIPLVEELTEAKYRRLDPVPEAEADISSPRRQRHC